MEILLLFIERAELFGAEGEAGWFWLVVEHGLRGLVEK
ncbi:MAG: hypothetical protein ACJAQT_000515 [Akkermansiaceae bacterium]|jgi:hypothetical protein